MQADSTYRKELVRLLSEAFTGPAWHGPALRSALRGVTAVEAAWRPGRGRNSIQELALHAAYAKHRVLRRLAPDQAAKFPRSVARGWWPVVSASAERSARRQWEEDSALPQVYHDRLIAIVRVLPERRLHSRRGATRFTLGQEISGIALHDIYHAGQIRLLRRLFATSRHDY